MEHQRSYATPTVSPGPMVARPWRLLRKQQDTYDTFTIEITPGYSGAVSRFLPGQFNMLYVLGVGEVPISISGDPSTTTSIVHTIRTVGNVTLAIKKLRVGDPIGVRGPFGTPWPVEKAKGYDVLIAAGGIGFAPLRPSIYHILENRGQYGKVVVLYGTRSPEDLLFREDLERWRSRFDVEVLVSVDHAAGEWRGNVGVVTTLIPKVSTDPSSTIAMVCGPEVMMRFMVTELQKRGISAENIYLSMERNMKCGIAQCGHCQFGPYFICNDGPVFPFNKISRLMTKREV
jgi:NAD(P)H-flavin reductase